jgi:transposase
MEEEMNLIELAELLLDEQKAEQYLLEVGILKTFTACEKCGSAKLGRIRRGRYKCYGCKAEWSFRKDSMLHLQSINVSKFIGVIMCFYLELTSLQAMELLKINRKTTDKIYSQIRLIISDLDADQLEKYNTIIKNETATFAIKIDNSRVNISIKNDESDNESEFTLTRTRVPNSNATYLFNYQRIKHLLHNDKLEKFPTLADQFFRFTREKLLKFRGTKHAYLYLYLKEIEFRYNNKEENIFDKIVEKIANFEGWQILPM